jgi:peptide/nickel transport system permease protein
MIEPALRRGWQIALTLLVGSFLVFVATEFSPGTVASKVLGPYALESQVALLQERLRLHDPLFLRYLRWLGTLTGLTHNELAETGMGLGLTDPRGPRYFGNLGFSLMQKEPVLDVLSRRLWPTVELTLWAIALMIPLALALGIVAGVHAGTGTDRAVSGATIILTSLPEFVTGVTLILIFTAWLDLLPGTSTMDPGNPWSHASQLVMPVAVLVVASGAYVARIVRASVADTMRRPFVRAARMKGIGARRVIVHHVLRNALIAPVTVILLQINWLLTGVVVVEAVFAYPGVGSLLLRAAQFGDIYLVQALALLALCVAVGTQVVGDILYRLIDPRIGR